MSQETHVKIQNYGGLFMIALATLMYEILLTRIFSVITMYHFAFLAISIAMFGLTVGAILVYLLPNYFRQDRTQFLLSLNSLLFSITIILSFLIFLRIPMKGFISNTLIFAIISVPFIFGGICICLALTRFPKQVSKLYAADLAGAAIGCIFLIYVVDITGGPTAVFVIAFISCIGTIFFAMKSIHKKLYRTALVLGLLMATFVAIHTPLVNNQSPMLRLKWVKGNLEGPSLYEKWNSFSRIRVFGNPEQYSKPFGWGLSPNYPKKQLVRQLFLNLDASALTVITGFDGNLKKIEYLKYDITNIVHFLRNNADVLVIGAGGGRDILSALAFDQKSVLGVEINQDIIKIINQRFGDFTGHLDKNPKVTFVNDEGRSYIERSPKQFDIIQASLIDTWAASAAGAFALTENSLYTIEAWGVFLDHLSPDGILTFSRWYRRYPNQGEIYRLVALAQATLASRGIDAPQNHIALIKCMVCQDHFAGVGTILVSKKPFSKEELDTLDFVSNLTGFEVVQSPRTSSSPVISSIVSGVDPDTLSTDLNLTAPTDNSPFFFNTKKLSLAFSNFGKKGSYNDPIEILVSLLISMIVLTLLCVFVPLILTTKKGALKGTGPFLLFFGSIGFGFMLIEISQMQRLIIFLGHPTYALSVVLFALLLSTGLGSYLTQKITNADLTRSAVLRLSILLAVLVIFGILTQNAINLFRGSITPVRILVTIGILIPLGLVLGMPFPFGIRLASVKNLSPLTPWFWGINGATSVCASVLAIAIALGLGISASFWTGVTFYMIAFISFLWASRKIA